MSQSGTKRSFYSKYFREIEVVQGLQTPPEEREWLTTAPKDDVQSAEVVLYLGCNVLRTSNLVQTVVDIFKLLEVDFVAVGGASYCCGIQHFQNGDEKAARSLSESTVNSFKKFNPQQVVMWCPSCIYFYDEIMQMGDQMSFQHVNQFLVENLDRLPFKKEVDAKVSLHYHTGRPQSDEEARCASQLLSAVPGLDLIDLGSDERYGRHCTDRVRAQVGPDVWDGIVVDSFERAVEANVDIFSTLYHGCQRFLCGYEKDYPVKVEHYLTLVGRALGIEHEDLYKKYMLMGDTDAIMAETSPCAVASGVSPEEARAAIQKIFVKPSS